MTHNLDITIRRGSPFTLNASFVDGGGADLDTTGMTFEAAVYIKGRRDNPLATLTVINLGGNDRQFTLTAAQTRSLHRGQHLFELQITDAAGVPWDANGVAVVTDKQASANVSTSIALISETHEVTVVFPPAGSQGPAGAPGADGASGADGADGADGAPGEQGPPGEVSAAQLASAITAHEGASNPHPGYATDTDLADHAATTHGGAADVAAHEGASNPHPDYATDTDLSSAISTHEGASNPHADYLTETEHDALDHTGLTGVGGGGGFVGAVVQPFTTTVPTGLVTWTKLDLHSFPSTPDIIDTDGFHDHTAADPTRDQLVIPAGMGGTYKVWFMLTCDLLGAGKFWKVRIRKGASTMLIGPEMGPTDEVAGPRMSAEWWGPLAAGDTITIEIMHNHGSNRNVAGIADFGQVVGIQKVA